MDGIKLVIDWDGVPEVVSRIKSTTGGFAMEDKDGATLIHVSNKMLLAPCVDYVAKRVQPVAFAPVAMHGGNGTQQPKHEDVVLDGKKFAHIMELLGDKELNQLEIGAAAVSHAPRQPTVPLSLDKVYALLLRAKK